MHLKTSLVVLSALLALTVGLVLAVAPASSMPAETSKGTGCIVEDANGVHYFDAECRWHQVVKRDKNGNIAFVHYQDHGQLPPGAALPGRALHTTLPFFCGGCILQGNYEQVITPSGEYKSKGPF